MDEAMRAGVGAGKVHSDVRPSLAQRRAGMVGETCSRHVGLKKTGGLEPCDSEVGGITGWPSGVPDRTTRAAILLHRVRLVNRSATVSTRNFLTVASIWPSLRLTYCKLRAGSSRTPVAPTSVVVNHFFETSGRTLRYDNAATFDAIQTRSRCTIIFPVFVSIPHHADQ